MEALKIYNNKIKSKKPIFTAKRRSKKFGTGPFDLKNVYLRELTTVPKPEPKFVIFKDTKAPIDPIKLLKLEDSFIEDTSSDTSSDISNTSIPSQISEIEPIEEFDI